MVSNFSLFRLAKEYELLQTRVNDASSTGKNAVGGSEVRLRAAAASDSPSSSSSDPNAKSDIGKGPIDDTSKTLDKIILDQS